MSGRTVFCFTCKRHVPVHGETEADRLRGFHASGHSAVKVKRLLRGLVGTPTVAKPSKPKKLDALDLAAADELGIEAVAA